MSNTQNTPITPEPFVLSGVRSPQKAYTDPSWRLSLNPVGANTYRFGAVHYTGSKPLFYMWEVKAQELPYLLSKPLEELCYMTRTKHEEKMAALERSIPTPSAFSGLTLSDIGL